MVRKFLFLVGLLMFLIGQIMLAQGIDYVYALRPIDFAHWSLLIGAVLLLPHVMNPPNKLFSYFGVPLATIGIVCMVGMYVLDFIWWSYADAASRQPFTAHIVNVPAIWKPFISIGPSSKVFNLGLLFLSLNDFKKHKIGCLLVLLACLVLWHPIPTPHRLVTGYTLTLLGFGWIYGQQIVGDIREAS